MKNNYDEIKIRIPKGEKERAQVLAAKREQSVNAMVWQMIEEELNNEQRPGVAKTPRRYFSL